MKRLALLIALIMLSFSAISIDVKKVIVERRDIGETLGTYILPIKIKGKGYVSHETWRSPKGIVCRVALFEHASQKEKGTFECQSFEGFKAQVSLDCSKNYSSDSARYLFFGRVSHIGENSNFYVWCE